MSVIAIGGFQHETNTFAPSKADYNAFEQGGGWPPLTFGEADRAAPRRAPTFPAPGRMAALHGAGHRTPGTAWGAASPSAHVTKDAFERIVGEMTARLAQAGPVDGVYLDLHGAMVTEHLDDGEGEILARVRRVVGPKVPIVASLDLHANVTERMIDVADGLVAYRTYPHIDMAATGKRAAELLMRTLSAGRPLARAFRPLDFLTGCRRSRRSSSRPATLRAARGAGARARRRALVHAGLSDGRFSECQMAVFGYGPDPARVQRAVDLLASAIHDAEPEFAMELLTPQEGVARAAQRGDVGAPVVLADTQDNPGAGGNGDTTGLLAALARARPARCGARDLLIDRASAKQAHEVGRGAHVAIQARRTSGVCRSRAARRRVRKVVALADGKFTCTGPMFKGFRMELGRWPCCAKATFASCSPPEGAGRGPGNVPARRHRAVKQRVLRAQELGALSRGTSSPSPARSSSSWRRARRKADPTMFEWTRLRPGLRLKPGGPAFHAKIKGLSLFSGARHSKKGTGPYPMRRRFVAALSSTRLTRFSPIATRLRPSATSKGPRSATRRGRDSKTPTRRWRRI
jgi:microcystin degradation protein MlrC